MSLMPHFAGTCVRWFFRGYSAGKQGPHFRCPTGRQDCWWDGPWNGKGLVSWSNFCMFFAFAHLWVSGCFPSPPPPRETLLRWALDGHGLVVNYKLGWIPLELGWAWHINLWYKYSIYIWVNKVTSLWPHWKIVSLFSGQWTFVSHTGVSWNRGTPKSSIYRRIFPYKPSIWRYPMYGHLHTHIYNPPYSSGGCSILK